MKTICRHIRLNESLVAIFFLCITPHRIDASPSVTIDRLDNSSAVVAVSGTVKNNNGIPFDSVEVQAIDPSTDSIVVSTLTNSSGGYSLSVNQGIYNIKAIPPAGSGFTPTVLLGQTISSASIIDFVLVPAGTSVLSGKITDRDGNPVVNQLVQLSSFTSLIDTTDALGGYSFIVTPGTYTLSTPSSPGIVHPHLPEMFYLWSNELVLSGNTILNIQLPNILADITVVDPADNPVSGTTLRTELAMTSTTFSAGPVLFHGNFDPYGVTDSAGHALVWMFPTTTNIKISPPAGSGFAPMSLDTVSVQTDTLFTVHLIPAITLSGKMTDRDGNPVVNQLVQLSSFTSLIDTTDVLGNYSFSVSPGTYTFSTPSSPGIVHPHLPEMFYLWADHLVLSADSIIDIQLPNVSLAMTILDASDVPVPGTIIRTELAMTTTTFGAGSVQFHGNFDPYGVTDSVGQALVWMFPTTTTIKISPPIAGGFAPMSLDTVSIHADTVINVHLIPSITLSGTITDRDTNPVVNQLVQLSSFTSMTDTTDALGRYSFSVSPGTYTFSTPASPGVVHPHLPEMFYLWTNNLSIAESTSLNIQLPNISLAVTVLDLTNNPVPGTTIRTELAMTYTTFSAESVLFHGNFDPYGITDSAGRALVWMFPTTTNIKISPPAASGFAPIMVDSVTIVSDKSMVVHLESILGVRPRTPVPSQFTLLQNYPNPFNPTTTIDYALPVSGFVTLTVTDIMGREAAVLINENKQGGRWYSVTCDMRNFSAGVYFYHMRVGEFRETRKFVVLK